MLGGVTAAPEAAMVALSTLRLRVGGPPSPPSPQATRLGWPASPISRSQTNNGRGGLLSATLNGGRKNNETISISSVFVSVLDGGSSQHWASNGPMTQWPGLSTVSPLTLQGLDRSLSESEAAVKLPSVCACMLCTAAELAPQPAAAERRAK